MKRLGIMLSILMTLYNPTFSQSEAGAIFLLIAPGARAGGMGEAQVAVANDAYASYWNPAGLGFLEGQELALMHVNWLPGLADDLYYEFFAFRKKYPTLGTLGGHLIFLNLGEQIRTSETGDELGTFTSYMTAFSLSYSALISKTQSFGINTKISYQHLVEIGAGAEKGKGTSIDFGFDLGYMHKEWLTPNLTFGLNLSNLGPKVSFIDPDQADPQPTNLSIGFNYAAINSEFNKLNIVYDVDKLLVSSYPDMDWDGDGYIGGFDEDGNESPYNDYNSNRFGSNDYNQSYEYLSIHLKNPDGLSGKLHEYSNSNYGFNERYHLLPTHVDTNSDFNFMPPKHDSNHSMGANYLHSSAGALGNVAGDAIYDMVVNGDNNLNSRNVARQVYNAGAWETVQSGSVYGMAYAFGSEVIIPAKIGWAAIDASSIYKHELAYLAKNDILTKANIQKAENSTR